MTELTIRTDVGEYSPYEFYCKVAENVTRNCIFSGGAAVFTWVVSGVWLLGAKVLFWVGAAVWVMDTLHGLIGALAGVSVALARRGRGESGWVWAAQAVRALEMLVGAIVLYWLAGKLGLR